MGKEIRKMVVLNPVVRLLLDDQDYKGLIGKLQNEFDYATDSTPGIAEVKRNYGVWAKKIGQSPVIDSRCPYIVDLVRKEFPHYTDLLAPFDPILITGAKIRREEAKSAPEGTDIKLLIVAPCRGFVRYSSPGISVCTWRDLKEEINFYPKQKSLESSPIPPGFFNNLEVRVYSASGEKECRNLLTNHPNDAQLLELLFCQGGCHRGDGL